MLNWLKIKNLALIEEADVEFGNGFNVITGETGAGKSILLSTISLLLGERADKGIIRTGAERCEISAGIGITAQVAAILEPALKNSEISFNSDCPEIQLRRVITKTQTRNFINDTPVTLQTLENIGNYLVDIHAANEHQSLLSRSRQLEILDRYAGLETQVAGCGALCEKIRNLRQERDLAFAEMPSAVEAEHLHLIINEIEKVNPEPGEDEKLNSRHQLAANAKTIMELAGQSVQMLNESEDSIADRLAQVHRNIQELCRIDAAKAETLVQSCDRINEMTRELAYDLEDFSSKVELDEQEFSELEARLSSLQTLKRRYGPGLENVLIALTHSRERLEVYRNAEKLRIEYAAKERELLGQLKSKAEELSSNRRTAAGKMAVKVKEKLKTLGFLQCAIEIGFSQVEPGERGMDRIDFLFSANPGETLQPLRSIASSGEISRVMLALKTVLADADAVPVLIFDEIDVNIGGETANQVGLELKSLAKSRQVLCISHLPQVAACGDFHFTVSKCVTDNRTVSTITPLFEGKRTTEIARMLGGGKAATAHAEDLLGHHKGCSQNE
ncbi:MAG: DNA repair protein RecN [Victivallaceae bacterium]